MAERAYWRISLLLRGCAIDSQGEAFADHHRRRRSDRRFRHAASKENQREHGNRGLGTGFPQLKVLVLADHDRDLRIAHVMRSEPSVERVAFLGPPSSSVIERVETPAGFDLVVSPGPQAFAVAAEIGAAALSAAEIDVSPVPAVVGASLLGLGLAMAARLESQGTAVTRVAVARPGPNGSGPIKVGFPPPVGGLSGVELLELPVKVVEATAPPGWASVLVEGNGTRQAVVDDHLFLSTIALAAGIALVPPAGIVRVWDSPQIYLARAEAMGLVAAIRP